MSYRSAFVLAFFGLERGMRRRRPTQARKLPKQDRAKVTVEAILAATAHILVRDGFDAASTNHIAEKAGVSIGSLYQYFPSKEAIVAALLQRHVRQMLAVMQGGLERWMSHPLRRVTRAMVRAMIAAHAVEPELHRVFMEEMPQIGRLEGSTELERRFEELAKTYLERHREAIRPRNLEIAAFVVVQSVEALTHAAVLYRPEKLRSEEFLNEVTELVVRYLGRNGHHRAVKDRLRAAGQRESSPQSPGLKLVLNSTKSDHQVKGTGGRVASAGSEARPVDPPNGRCPRTAPAVASRAPRWCPPDFALARRRRYRARRRPDGRSRGSHPACKRRTCRRRCRSDRRRSRAASGRPGQEGSGCRPRR